MGTMAAGYSVLWLAVVAYVAWMRRRQAQLEEQYQRLQEQLRNAGSANQSSSGLPARSAQPSSAASSVTSRRPAA